MRYEFIAARFSLALTALLWTDVLCTKCPTPFDDSKDQKASLNIEPAPSTQMSSPWLDLNDDLLSCICQFYGPVRFNGSDRDKIGKVVTVLTALSRLFENLKYVGLIEVDEILAYYLLLSELSHVKKFPSALERMLVRWRIPKGNLGLSLLISTGEIGESTLTSMASYLPHIPDMSARLAAVNYCLDACATNAVLLDFDINHYPLLCSALVPSVMSKWRRILIPSGQSSALIASSLLHFAPAELDEAEVKALKDALDYIMPTIASDARSWFCGYFIRHPVLHRDQYTRQDIFVHNVQVFQAISFTDEQRITLSVVNKIKFGALQDMSPEERKVLFDILWDAQNFALVFHIWARAVDVSASIGANLPMIRPMRPYCPCWPLTQKRRFGSTFPSACSKTRPSFPS